MIVVLKILGLLFFVLVLYHAVRMRVLIQRGKKVAKNAVAFQRILPEATMRILIAGDSTAVGTGAARPEESVAGRFSSDYPDAEIVNVSRNGMRVRELLSELEGGSQSTSRLGSKNNIVRPEWRTSFVGSFDLIVLQIGANDIVYFTPLSQLREDLDALLKRARELSHTVLILHSGNLGAAPLFPWPVSTFYTARTRRVRSLYQELAVKGGAHYVDLFQERRDDIFLQDPEKYYLTDLYHPSSDGYGVWYRRIRETLDEIDWNE